MTNKAALEALARIEVTLRAAIGQRVVIGVQHELALIRAALEAKGAPGEAVAWRFPLESDDGWYIVDGAACPRPDVPGWQPLYAAPPPVAAPAAPQGSPTAWIATLRGSGPIHLTRADGWVIEAVTAELPPAALPAIHGLCHAWHTEKAGARCLCHGTTEIEQGVALPPAAPREGGEERAAVFKFLLGEGELDGLWFGDTTDRPAFWWRKHLRSALLRPGAGEKEGEKP